MSSQNTPTFGKAVVESIFGRVLAKKGAKAGKPIEGETLRRYITGFWSVYKDIGDRIYDSRVLEEYLLEVCENDNTRKASLIAITHFMQSFRGGEDWEMKKAGIEKLSGMFRELCKDDFAKEESMAKKRGIVGKYRQIPYKALLLSLAEGAVEKDPDNFRLQQTRLAFLLLSANEPLRCDHKNVVIAERCPTLPPNTPYYKDGFIHFPIASMVKVPNAEPLTQDVSEHQQVVEDFISKHSSRYLFGYAMEPVTYAHLLLDGSQAQLGDRLGIRFFRTKYSSDNWAMVHGASKMVKGMNNKLSTQERYYAVIPN